MEDLGFSDCMGPELRMFVEKKLALDLKWYLPQQQRFQRSDVIFDWSESCIEGHRTRWLDGEIENFSSIAVLDADRRLIAEGWMEFIETELGLEVFWWRLDGAEQSGIQSKVTNEVPSHVWDRLSPEMQSSWNGFAPKHPFP